MSVLYGEVIGGFPKVVHKRDCIKRMDVCDGESDVSVMVIFYEMGG